MPPTTLTRARQASCAPASVYHTAQVCLSVQIRNPPFLHSFSCIALRIWRPPQTNKLCFCLKQFSKRRATGAINYISVIKVPTSDLAWPARTTITWLLHWSQFSPVRNGGYLRQKQPDLRNRWLKSAVAFAHTARRPERRRHNKRTPLSPNNTQRLQKQHKSRWTLNKPLKRTYLDVNTGHYCPLLCELLRRFPTVGAAPHPSAFLSQPDWTLQGGSTRGPSEGGEVKTGLLPMTTVVDIKLQHNHDETSLLQWHRVAKSSGWDVTTERGKAVRRLNAAGFFTVWKI